MEHNVSYLGLIPLMPLIGAVVIGLMHMFTCTGKRISEKVYSTLAVIGPVLACILAVKAFIGVSRMPASELTSP